MPPDDIGEIIIKVSPEEAEQEKALKKAGKEGGKQMASELTKGLQRFAGNAAAAVGGAKARGATNLLFAGGLGPKGLLGKGKAAIAAGGGMLLAGAGIAAFLAALTLSTRAINKDTKARRDRLAAVTPVLALAVAKENMTVLQRNIIEGRLFGEQIAANSAKLAAAGNEFFRFKLAIAGMKVQLGSITAGLAEGAAKLLNFFTIDLIKTVRDSVGDIMFKIGELLGLLPDEDPEAKKLRHGEGGADTEVGLLNRILREVESLRDNANFAGVNRIMLQEVQRMSTQQPKSSQPRRRGP